MATSFSGGRSRSTRREPPTMGKQLVNLITCGCESSAPLFVIYKAGRETTSNWWYASGTDPRFQVRAGGTLKKLRRVEGGAKIVGVFRVKNHDFTPKNLIFSNFRGACSSCWVIQLLNLLSHPGPLCYIYCVMVRVSINQKAIGIHVQNYKFGNCILFG
jgi:hypothetical protein